LRFPDLPWIGDDRRRSLFAAVEAVLVVGLAWQAAALFWILLSPQVPAPAGPVLSRPDGLAVLTRFDPFFRSAPAAMSEAAAQAFRLYGVRAGGGGAGSAIIGGPDGSQASFAVGDEVAPGVRLDSVADDHVVLARGGARTSLYFPTATPTVAQDQVQP
jgi:general secretion pathway protein C